MLQPEFEALIGHKVSKQDFEKAERVYNATDLSKQDFCKHWSIDKPNAIIDDLTTAVVAKNAHIHTLRAKAEACASRMLSIAAKTGDDKLKDAAIEFVGIKQAAIMDLRQGNALNQNERDYICDKLEASI